ncbi:uncharacterized protein LOC111316331 [Durio zibethinus]|uniref:Uncharacterized protein LOC111316331 n=1 Tax=Durio zibethinus TaxID=66656 RepID=A0A6P6BAD4_DURZI|nr:uncharacterized protein LOC111316331 [Durio zibethinus]
MVGSNFTWTRTEDGGKILERLDRGLCDTHFLTLFPSLLERHLMSTTSDHLPLLFSLRESNMGNWRSNRTFGFENMWVGRAECEEIINMEWRNRQPKNMEDLCQRRLEPHEQGSDGFEQDKRDLNDLLHHEEVVWRQQAREMWLREGDRDTRYFHSVASRRRRNNASNRIQGESGQWYDHREHVEAVFLHYFENLYKSTNMEGVDSFCGLVLANGLKMVLPMIISEIQSAFVPGRSIFGNAMVAFKTS